MGVEFRLMRRGLVVGFWTAVIGLAQVNVTIDTSKIAGSKPLKVAFDVVANALNSNEVSVFPDAGVPEAVT